MTRDKSRRAAYTLEYKPEAVRFVKGGKAKAVTAKVLGIPRQTLDNWVRFAGEDKLAGAGGKPVSAEQMELARLRAELACVKMERDILKKRRRTSRRSQSEVRLDQAAPSQVTQQLAMRGTGGKGQRLL